jgi:precorrin-3B synthase
MSERVRIQVSSIDWGVEPCQHRLDDRSQPGWGIYIRLVPTRERPADACPGALQVHRADDGGLARIRVPGGRLTANQLRTLLAAAPDGTLELTSRANVQIRGLVPGAEWALGSRLAEAGLLPSATHERVRNIIASPLGDAGLVRALDAELCARPALAGLPGRFLFIVDSGAGDVAWLDGDVTALFVAADTAAILLGGLDVGLRASSSEVVRTMLACAERFLALRHDEWRIAELESGPARVAEAFALVTPGVPRGEPVSVGPVGRIGPGSLGAAVPLGRLTLKQGTALAGSAGELVVTPWRGVVLPEVPPDEVDGITERLAATGLLLDPDAPGVGVTACVGRPGCAKALADVRADAAAAMVLARRSDSTVPAHWSGCERRCGRPRGDVLDVVATGTGYTTRRGFE